MRFISLLPMLLLTSCSPAPLYFEVKSEGASTTVEIYKRWWFGLRSNEVPCVHDVTLTQASNVNVIWRIVATPERQCAKLRSFVIGRVPQGFQGTARPEPLSSGHYTLTASGIGSGTTDFHVIEVD